MGSYAEERERGGVAVEKAIQDALKSVARGNSLRKAAEDHGARSRPHNLSS